jgi:hypothetical protein
MITEGVRLLREISALSEDVQPACFPLSNTFALSMKPEVNSFSQSPGHNSFAACAWKLPFVCGTSQPSASSTISPAIIQT